jgi:SAM-dependent methyltransferase
MKIPDKTAWPKNPPPLTADQEAAREAYRMLWHQRMPTKYAVVERFNHGFPVRLPLKTGSVTLEIGAGLGAHAEFEDLTRQNYHFLEYREEFCKEIRQKHPSADVRCGDIEKRQPWADGYFDRIVAIHVLEHLRNLPLAIQEISRLLKADGALDIVIPCEGGFAHSLGRKITAERLFRKNFKMDFTPIRKNEHVNTYQEIMSVLRVDFAIQESEFFPLKIPLHNLNFCAGFRLIKLNDCARR